MDNKLKIFALGGLNEVGKNCYILEKNEELIIIDCGVKFANEGYSLIDGIIPNFNYLKEKKEKIKGLFITHGHEDHIGGIPYLLEEVGNNFPIYGSAFSLALIKAKLGAKESQVKSVIFDDDTAIQTTEFRVTFFRVTHSIPGAFGLIVETNKARVILTGDFKFDWTEIGEKSDLAKLAECGKKGVDLLLSDSTNAEVQGSTPSERKVISRLENIISHATGRVIITSFASNVYRLKKTIDIAKKHQRKILLLGSSLEKMLKVIQKVSLWKIDNSIFIKTVLGSKKVPPQNLLIFCTGSQGEARAVLSRLANQTHPEWKITHGDTIILTSSAIMDNRYNLEVINNRLFELGAIIYENNKEELLHASGHACQEDLKLMLTLVNPRYFMPFHGDYRMLKAHGYLAQETGVLANNIFVCENGEIIQGKENKEGKIEFFRVHEKINAQPNYVFKGKIVYGDWWKKSLDLRYQMLTGGTLIVLFFYNKEKKHFELPHIYTYGFINIEKNKNLIVIWKKELYNFVNASEQKKDPLIIKKKMVELVAQKYTKDKPLVVVHVEEAL